MGFLSRLRSWREPFPMGETRHFLADPLPPIGRARDTETIKNLLQENRVVTIHGIVGSGKTRLAKFVSDSEDEFDRIWICVSDGFKFGKVIKKILGGKSVSGMEDDGALSAKVQARLRKRRFLVVLDDLWSDDEAQWGMLARSLMEISDQGKIIVTTSKQSVVDMIDAGSSGTATVASHHLNVLSDEDLLLLLERYASTDGQEIPKVLRTIGEQIVAKCDGLPLAVKILAVLLSERREAAHWESIRDRNKDEFELLLWLCRDLPVYFKDRFFYFSPLLQDNHIQCEDLFDLWMTDGLFESLDQTMSVRVVEELKSIIERWKILHGLICHPKIIGLPENQCSVINASNGDIGRNVVHLSIDCLKFDPDLNSLNGLQTLFLWTTTRDFVCKLFSKKRDSKFKLLRMLNLRKSHLELPSSLDYMSRLKCLNLSWNSCMTKLPSFIFELRSLEILKLEGCTRLKKLPQGIKNLSGLKVLSITATIMDFPSGIESLTSLQSLLIGGCITRLPIGKYLTSLTALQSLTIYDCPNVVFKEEGAAAAANQSLLELKLEKLPNLEDLDLGTNSLRFLHIKLCEKLTKLPECLPQMPLESIVIDSCRQLLSLPEGMPQLESLTNLEIRHCPDLKNLIKEMMEDVDQRDYFEGRLACMIG